MKIFYDDNGNIIGSIEGATADIEATLGMPGTNEVTAPVEIAQRLADPSDELTTQGISIQDGEVVIDETPAGQDN